MKVIYCLMIFFCPWVSGAQTVKPLTVDDKVPDVTISNLYNYRAPAIHLSELTGKLVILDFWATWCSACLRNFSKMEALQQQFGDDIRVLAVTYEDKEKISRFFNSKAGVKYNFPTVVNDTLLSKLFPHTGIPHCVWIGCNGIVAAITGAEEVTAANIKKLLNQNTLQVQVKKDLDPRKPLFLSDDYPAHNQLLRYSILSKGWYSGYPSGNDLRKSGNKIIGHASTNLPLLSIYTSAAIHIFRQLGERYCEKRSIIEVKDVSEIKLNASGLTEIERKKVYSFDIIVPEADAANLYTDMLEELNRYTDYCGSIEKRNTDCLLLVRTDSADRIRSKETLSSNTLFDKPPYSMTNYPVANFVNRLNSEEAIPLPVIDETHYKGNIDLHLSAFTDLQTLSQELRGYGLDLIRANRPLYMFILKDNPKHY